MHASDNSRIVIVLLIHVVQPGLMVCGIHTHTHTSKIKFTVFGDHAHIILKVQVLTVIEMEERFELVCWRRKQE